MLAEIERFVNWVRRRSPEAHTWQDYRCDLHFSLEVRRAIARPRSHLPGCGPFHRSASRTGLQAHHHQPPPGGRRRAVCLPHRPKTMTWSAR